MIVDLIDGRCRTCGSTLRVIDVVDGALTVNCIECRDTYDVESDAFGDSYEKYYLAFLNNRRRPTQKKKGQA